MQPQSVDRLRPRVIVADDEADAVRSLVALLELEGFVVRGFTNGFDVLHEVRYAGADAVLLDIGMPAIDGFQVARKLRERYASAKPILIAVTGRNTQTDRDLSKAAGFDHHLAKPYDPGEVLSLLAPLVKKG